MHQPSDWKNFVPTFSEQKPWTMPCSLELSNMRKLLEVSGRYAGAETDESKQYFENLLALSTGGRASSVAHFLYTRDLSNFRPRSLPETRATMQQKVLSLNDVQRWWLKCLRDGEVPAASSFNGADNNQGHITQWTLWRRKADVHEKYKEFCKNVGVQAAEDSAFWVKLSRCALLENARRTDHGPVKQKVYVVSFKPHSDNVQHFASKVLRVSTEMFLSGLHNESSSVPRLAQNAPPYAPLFPAPVQAAAVDGAMQVLGQNARGDGDNAFEAEEDAADTSASQAAARN